MINIPSNGPVSPIWYRFNERTGERTRITACKPLFINFITNKMMSNPYFKMDGEPRKSVRHKGKTYFLEK